ncbi:MAG: tRNA epoxyqueuosine(34) reductase QueG [Firmicutes bacterium]|nr:tRNA epoxyqueuosine(34) reductase QueG [Bacillota bacterium]
MIETVKKILTDEVDAFGFIDVPTYVSQYELYHQEVPKAVLDELQNYQTIITLGLSYPSVETPYLGRGYGILSRYSYHLDYHIVFRAKLAIMEQKLNALGYQTSSSVDISNINERLAAKLSNMGYIGKNQFLINKKYGSYLYLATILIDLKIDTEDTLLDDCGNCRACVTACPTNALEDGFHEKRCLSYLTQAKKEFSMEEISHLKTMIYGCDICQKVCPKNTGIDFHLHPEFEPSGIENINLLELLSQSNQKYLNRYKENASSWRGGLVMKRNALCLIANQNMVEAIPKIKETMVKYHDVLWYNKTAQKVVKILEGK